MERKKMKRHEAIADFNDITRFSQSFFKQPALYLKHPVGAIEMIRQHAGKIVEHPIIEFRPELVKEWIRGAAKAMGTILEEKGPEFEPELSLETLAQLRDLSAQEGVRDGILAREMDDLQKLTLNVPHPGRREGPLPMGAPVFEEFDFILDYSKRLAKEFPQLAKKNPESALMWLRTSTQKVKEMGPELAKRPEEVEKFIKNTFSILNAISGIDIMDKEKKTFEEIYDNIWKIKTNSMKKEDKPI